MTQSSNIAALIRHILTFGGGYAVAKGYGDTETWTAIAGAVATVVGGFWSIFKEQKRKQVDAGS